MPKYLLLDAKYYRVMVPTYLKYVRYDGIPVMTDEPATAKHFNTPGEAEEFRAKHLRTHWFRTFSLENHATNH